MGYKIRTVRRADWRQARELRLAALADPMAPVAFNETYTWAVAQEDEFWKQRAEPSGTGLDAQTLVGEDEQDGARWVGTVTVLWEGECAHVVAVYVRPEHRGTGLAAELFEAVEERALERDGVHRLRLHVHERNPRAEAFYKRLGFTRTGRTLIDPKDAEMREFEMVRALCRGRRRHRGS